MNSSKHSETHSAIRRESQAGRASGSFLVRVWYEARDSAEEAPSFRAYIRNLQSGEERFVKDPQTVGRQMARQVGEPDSSHSSSSHEFAQSQHWRVAR